MAATSGTVSRAHQRLAELGAIEQRQECLRRAFQAIEDRHLGMQHPVLDQWEYLLLEGDPAVQVIEYQEALEPQSLDNQLRKVARRRCWRLYVAGDHPADGRPAVGAQQVARCLQVSAS